MSDEPASWPSAAERGPIVITWDFGNRALLLFNSHTHEQLQLAVTAGMERLPRRLGKASGAGRRTWYSKHIAAARKIQTLIGSPKSGRIDINNASAQELHDLLAALTIEFADKTNPPLVAALRDLLLLAGEAYIVHLSRIPSLPSAPLEQAIPWAEDAPENYLRLRATAPEARCALSIGAVARLARWLAIMNPSAPVLLWLGRQMRRIARLHIRAQQRLETHL